ncbi:NAD-dependent epimerase/dehydratase family protein [Streptomyces fumanus]|uniref:NAD-dependent epimerase/dehydratase family protein n=1 Tax=Streptomyces fumanus TaxID=67302 RepID=UPI0033D43BCA
MRVLVTGGSGFLGREICRRLVARGTAVRSLSRRRSPFLDRIGVSQHQGDLADGAAVSRAVAGCDCVIHNAALAGVSGPLGPYWATNVQGTRNVVEQCRAHGVGILVHTSTASVVFPPGGLENADESIPYPDRHLAAYPFTKAHAERLVLAAHGPDLTTVCLRPHLIWGPGDPHFTPALTRAVRSGRLPMPGAGANLVDTTHLRTAAHAHLCALDRLSDRPGLGGRAYFIGQGEPRPLREIVHRLLGSHGVEADWLALPPRLAQATASVVEQVQRATGSKRTGALSRFLVAELLHPHYFDLTAAHRDLGFRPPLSVDAGLADLARSHAAAPRGLSTSG